MINDEHSCRQYEADRPVTVLVLNENFRLRFAARSFMLLPWAIPGTLAVLTWRWMFSDVVGSLNYFLKMTGLIQKDILWLSSSSAFWAIVMIDNWRGTPFMGLSILSGLQSRRPRHSFWLFQRPLKPSVWKYCGWPANSQSSTPSCPCTGVENPPAPNSWLKSAIFGVSRQTVPCSLCRRGSHA